MNKSESKYHNTALKMQGALIHLLEKKEFSEISITEICSEASINRSTFYAHYNNTCDLLKETCVERLKQLFHSFPYALEEIQTLHTQELNFISDEFLIPYLKFVKENKRFFKVYLKHLQEFDADSTYLFLLHQVFLPIFEKSGVSDQVTADYMSKFYLQGITSVVLEWVNRDCAEAESFLCNIIITCIRPHIRS